MDDVVVIGGGAAGIFAALEAARLGAKTLILEKTPRLGTKILISGGGKCNITHDGSVAEILKCFRPDEARFLRPTMYETDNQAVLDVFHQGGLATYVRPDGRIFPVDANAKDVMRILTQSLVDAGIEVRLNAAVRCLQATEGLITGATTDQGPFAARTFILAVGGSSYPQSGTTGDGFRWAKSLRIPVSPVTAALAPIELAQPMTDCSGVALRDCRLRAKAKGKEIARWEGDLLFTHQGISGPCALGISREVSEHSSHEVTLFVDLAPQTSPEDLGQEVQRLIQAHPKRQTSSLVEGLLPERLVPIVLAAAKVDGTIPNGQLKRPDRNRLIEVVKYWPLGVVKCVPLAKGEVVAGGISRERVDSRTMRIEGFDNLFAAGEVLDVAGPVGGYNLQAAFSTGAAAGRAAARLALDRPSGP